MHALLEPPK
jgi:hypothetical protein